MPTAPTRLLDLLTLLRPGRRWPAKELAGRLDVSARTLRRDIEALREAGYAITATSGPGGGYQLAQADLPPLTFDDDQVLAIAVALRTTHTSVVGLQDAARRALESIREVLPARLKARLDLVEVSQAPPPAAPETDPNELLTISRATRQRETLRFDYVTRGEDEPRLRRAEPYHVVARNGRWYLIAWDTDRGDWRTFRIDRIKTRIPNGPRFSPRDLPAATPSEFLADHVGGGPPRCRGTAIIHLPMAQIEPWAGPDSVLVPLGPERCMVTANSWTWGGLASWFGYFDAGFELLDPPELLHAARELTDRLTAAVSARTE